MRAYPEADTVVRGIVVVILLALGVVSWIWWGSHSQRRDAKREAMPGCVAQLGSEDACEARFDSYGRDCFVYNNKPAGKFTPREFNPAGYLECVVKGTETWSAERREQRSERRREDRTLGVPPRP